MDWYHPNPVTIPHWFTRLASFDCVADPDRKGLTLIVPDYPKMRYQPRALRIVRGGRREFVEPDDVQRVDRIGITIRAHYPVDLDNAAKIDMRVRWRRHPITVNVVPPRPKPIRLALSTLFRFDYWALPLWVEHYRQLGVEWFFLYFNGERADLERRLAKLGEFDWTDCTFVEWPFSMLVRKRYAWRGGKLRQIYGPAPNFHHAQPAEMLHAASAFAHHWEIPWMAYFDLDEFVMLKKWDTLRELLDGDTADVHRFECRWAEDRGDWATRGSPFKRGFADVYVRPTCEGQTQRTKYIVRVDRMILPDIHFPALSEPETVVRKVRPEDANFLHFHHFTHDRTSRFSDRDSWVHVKT